MQFLRSTTALSVTFDDPNPGSGALLWNCHVRANYERSSRMTIDFDAGVLLPSAVRPRGTSALASGK